VMRLSAAAASCARADTLNRQPAPLRVDPPLFEGGLPMRSFKVDSTIARAA
jgi:hypothetical protein